MEFWIDVWISWNNCKKNHVQLIDNNSVIKSTAKEIGALLEEWRV